MFSRWFALLVPVVLVGVLLVPRGREEAGARETVVAANGMVVCVSPTAAEVGVDVLKRGGNSVDAAVAVAVTMAVTYPPAGNIAGGGFMLIHRPDGKPVVIDYREMAPAASTRDMFAGGADPYSPKAVGVPGTLRGLELAHRKYGSGTLSWKQLVEPAVSIAQDGFPITRPLADSLNDILASARTPEEFRRVYGPPGDAEQWKAGDRLIQPDLAKTLRTIADHGADDFYTGETSKLIVREMERTGGLITAEDLANYQAKEREPIHGTYRGYDIYGAPPPSSGGVCLVEMLNILENFDLNTDGRWSARTNHRIIEAMKRTYRDRARYLGDADFVKDIPIEKLTSKAYAKELAESIGDTATPSAELAPPIELTGEGDSTTHFSIIDANGMAISNTYTLEMSYGSRIVVPEGGFLLNNEMTDFNHTPGRTDRRGAIGTEPNLPAPGKRMLSSQTPTIVARDGKPYLITGSPGGRTIINTVLCVVLNVIEFEMPIREAVDAPRLHHQWFPDVARFEGARTKKRLVQELQAMGHEVVGNRQGDAHSIMVDPESGRYHGAADGRIIGEARGY